MKCEHKWEYVGERDYIDYVEPVTMEWCRKCGSISKYVLNVEEGCMEHIIVNCIQPAKKSSECKKCGTPLIRGLCKDETCPYSDHPQSWKFK